MKLHWVKKTSGNKFYLATDPAAFTIAVYADAVDSKDYVAWDCRERHAVSIAARCRIPLDDDALRAAIAELKQICEAM